MSELNYRNLKSLTHRAQLLEFMCKYPDLDVASLAKKLGFCQVVDRVPEVRVELPIPANDRDKNESNTTETETVVEVDAVETLWMPTHFQTLSVSRGIIDPDRKATAAKTVWRKRPTGKVKHRSIMPWPATRRLLDPVISSKRNSSQPDIDRIIQKLANNHFIARIPLLQRSCFPAELTLIEDTSIRNIPYREDYRSLIRRIIELAPKDRVVWLKGDAPGRLICQLSGPKDRREPSREEPKPGSAILVLGDFGHLERQSGLASRLSHYWREWCHAMHLQYCELTALVPFSVDYLSPTIRRLITTVGWVEKGVEVVRDPNQREALIRQLFEYAYPATCVEPSLLRDLRMMVRGAADPSLESDFWQHPWLEGRMPSGAKNDQAQIKAELLRGFELLPPDTQERILRLLRNRRGAANAVDLWLSEFLNLTVSMQLLIDDHQSDREDAEEMIREMVECFETGEIDPGASDLFHWQTWGASSALLTNRNVGAWIAKYRKKFFPELPIDPELQSSGPGEYKVVTHLAVRTDGNNVEIQRLTPGTIKGGDWGVLRSCDGRVDIQAYLNAEQRFWKSGKKPDWVSNYGSDRYGLWCEFQVPKHDGQGVVVQQMRWIHPGTFMMGSPETEDSHRKDEIRHRVTLTKGYWIANTPCTQQMWKAIQNGENPSHFKQDNNPVETVSWIDVQNWISVLDKLFPTMNPSLPTEAQWEYACRAGSEDCFTFGNDMKELEKYARFNANSLAKSSPVKQLKENEWGIFDVHGNVWEWCQDWYDDYSKHSETDPTGPENGWKKVIRGGSWFDVAEFLRSSFRASDPYERSAHNVGFRLIATGKGYDPNSIDQQNEFKTISEFQIDECKNVRYIVNSEFPSPNGQPKAASSIIHKRFWRPEWADEAGIDRYGYAVQIRVRKNDLSATQWLRLIHPGVFKIGSPEEEDFRMPDREFMHNVEIKTAFWIFDTPCTQSLWQMVMNENNSCFKSPDRPVESISFHDAVLFAERLSQILEIQPGIDDSFRLPTEEEWEYACRAGTSTATYLGNLSLNNMKSFSVLDKIAWYGGNCFKDYDLDKGEIVGWQKEKKVAGTRNVREKQPNSWGLYDMLGNVWEYCSNWHQGYQPNESSRSNQLSVDTKNRVIRGGSWYDPPNYIRAACRFWQAGIPQNNHGFRLVVSDRRQEYITTHSPDNDFKEDNPVQEESRASDEYFKLRIKTDLEHLQFGPIKKPKWATNFGKDRFGFFSVFQVQKEKHEKPVFQKMRWIPPGKFFMGEEKAKQEVAITNGFWISDTPCTQSLWLTLASVNPSKFQDPERPVEFISFGSISKWINKLSNHLEVDPNYGFRLPKEAEWEFACRAGFQSFSAESHFQTLSVEETDLKDLAWFRDNSRESFDLDGYMIGTHPVARKLPNAWGLYDMLGNVWEFCLDAFLDDSSSVSRSTTRGGVRIDPFIKGTGEDDDRVVRGGCYSSLKRHVTPSGRHWYRNTEADNAGFRLVYSVNELDMD